MNKYEIKPILELRYTIAISDLDKRFYSPFVDGVFNIQVKQKETIIKFKSPLKIAKYNYDYKLVDLNLNDPRLDNLFNYFDVGLKILNRDEYISNIINELHNIEQYDNLRKILECEKDHQLFNLLDYCLECYIPFEYLNRISRNELIAVIEKLRDYKGFLKFTVETVKEFKEESDNLFLDEIKKYGYELIDY